MDPIPQNAFEVMVADALDELPDAVLAWMENVVILVEDDHPDDLLGLYEGIPHTDRMDYGDMVLPDRITLYRLALCRFVDDIEQLADEIHVTIVHEVAHHMGIDDDRLHELGWD